MADVININWPEVLSVEKMDPNYSFEKFDENLMDIIDKHVPLKKINKKQY